MIKYAADLKPQDVVDMPGEKRVVDRIEWPKDPIDSNGTQAVRVFWTNYSRSNLLAANKELRIIATEGD